MGVALKLTVLKKNSDSEAGLFFFFRLRGPQEIPQIFCGLPQIFHGLQITLTIRISGVNRVASVDLL